MKFTKTATAMMAASLALGAQAPAQADSLATAILNITNFKWTYVDGSGNTQNLSNIVSVNPHLNLDPSGQNTGGATVNLGASTATSTAQPFVKDGGIIPFKSECVGTGCGGAPTGAPPISTYSYASYELKGALIDIDTSNPQDGSIDVPAGVSAKTTAEVSLINNFSLANGDSKLGTTTSLTFAYTGPTLQTKLQLDYFAKAFAKIYSPFGVTDSARAGVAWSISLDDATSNTNVLDWSLFNKTVSATAQVPNPVQFQATGSDSRSFTLTSGDQYVLSINHQISAEAARDVPEPDSLALLGLGLSGLALPKLRRRMLAV